MDEERFNMEIRRFLKKVGITSQREIEKAVREALAGGTLKGDESLPVRVTLEMDRLGLSVPIDGEIELG
ncbi:MAG: hypothetical protein GEU92_09575 [Alphaproteobacteria bacterium]|nr:hypothetical protein [Alphaproteobacteria bacterium]